jgi:hypothetical protein
MPKKVVSKPRLTHHFFYAAPGRRKGAVKALLNQFNKLTRIKYMLAVM